MDERFKLVVCKILFFKDRFFLNFGSCSEVSVFQSLKVFPLTFFHSVSSRCKRKKIQFLFSLFPLVWFSMFNFRGLAFHTARSAS